MSNYVYEECSLFTGKVRYTLNGSSSIEGSITIVNIPSNKELILESFVIYYIRSVRPEKIYSMSYHTNFFKNWYTYLEEATRNMRNIPECTPSSIKININQKEQIFNVITD